MGAEGRVTGQSLTRLLAVTCTAVLVSVPFSAAAYAGSKTNATFTYSCCTAAVVAAEFHPGEVLRLPWVATADVPSAGKVDMVTLTAKISGPYKTVASLKSAFARRTPQLGKFNVEADQVRVSDGVAERTVELIKVPRDATAGFYELTTSTATHSLVVSGGAVIRVS